MTKGGKSPRISVSLPDKTYSEMTAIAEKYDISVAWLARHAIADFLSRYESEELQLRLPIPLKGKH
ncbi:ribbon-helix-helix domain-containing protein [Desulfovibrio inopinatus]|uniref:ribbon-helix-helix domain-containing protein n=1 Tax=Desulfovibrio inopinatus TaxID=102109 RepID=UPI0004836D62|nr:ribbon-helix-helix domain-containing protein [Desulfovibrio inopinatus]